MFVLLCITISTFSRADDLSSDLVLNAFEVQSIHGDRLVCRLHDAFFKFVL